MHTSIGNPNKWQQITLVMPIWDSVALEHFISMILLIYRDGNKQFTFYWVWTLTRYSNNSAPITRSIEYKVFPEYSFNPEKDWDEISVVKKNYELVQSSSWKKQLNVANTGSIDFLRRWPCTQDTAPASCQGNCPGFWEAGPSSQGHFSNSKSPSLNSAKKISQMTQDRFWKKTMQKTCFVWELRD